MHCVHGSRKGICLDVSIEKCHAWKDMLKYVYFMPNLPNLFCVECCLQAAQSTGETAVDGNEWLVLVVVSCC